MPLYVFCTYSVSQAGPASGHGASSREPTGLLAHIRATHFESGDRDRAVADARRIARFLERSGARRVVGIASAFDRTRPFTHRSDIDLVADGIPEL